MRFASLGVVSGMEWREGRGRYQVITWPELVPMARKLRKGKIIVTQKHQIGTPFFVHFLRNFGAWPSSASE